jgi:hypothetical protein
MTAVGVEPTGILVDTSLAQFGKRLSLSRRFPTVLPLPRREPVLLDYDEEIALER